jgi:antitoxin (DNA-binding transcriptional repressor) of toxin-antitoxin stability system
MHEAKTNLSKLVAAVERGDVEEVELARAGQVVARIVAASPPRGRHPGAWAGRVAIHDDFDELPDDIAAAFGGEGE